MAEPGGMAEPWPVPKTGLPGRFVQNSQVCESVVQRWYLAFCGVEPIQAAMELIQAAAEGGMPWEAAESMAWLGMILS